MTALSDLIVLELATDVAGPYCGKLFADHGARVVKIEGPEGDAARTLEPVLDAAPAGQGSALFAYLNANKQSVVLDVAAPTAAAQLQGWVQGADVVIESGGAGSLARFGLEHAALRALRPELVIVSLSWFGRSGPYRDHAASDAAIFALSGVASAIGPVEGPPSLPSGHQAQIVAGTTAFIGALGALHGRAAGLGGCHIDQSIFEAALCFTEVGAAASHAEPTRRARRRGHNRYAPTFPCGIYPCKDGWIGVTALTPPQWKSLCSLLELPELDDDARFGTSLERLAAADELERAFAPRLLQRTARDWFERGQAARLPLALVPSMGELLGLPQYAQRGAFARVDAPGLPALQVPQPPFQLLGTPARVGGVLAALGEHTAQLRAELTDAARGLGGPRVARPGDDVSAVPVASAERATDEADGLRREPVAQPIDDAPAVLHAAAGRPQDAATGARALSSATARGGVGMLSGVRVVDLSMGWSGPLATRHLADLGADVIKVEACQHVDWWRTYERTPEALAQIERSLTFNSMNRHKRGITLDLASVRGRELLLRLVGCSDVLIENNAASVLPKLGLGEAQLRAANPELISLSMPAFGASGPWRDYRAYGSTVEQSSGLPHLIGQADAPPSMHHVAWGDSVAGLNAAVALLIALWHKRRTGRGQRIDLSQVQCLFPLAIHGILERSLHGREYARQGNRHPHLAPHGVYRCAGDDRWIMIAVSRDESWRALCQVLGRSDLERDAALQTSSGRKAREAELDAALTAWTCQQDRDLAMTRLQAAGVLAAALRGSEELLAEPQLQARGFWQLIEREFVGVTPQPSTAYRFSERPLPIGSPAPTLGQHNREVFADLLGLAADEIAALEREGVIGTRP